MARRESDARRDLVGIMEDIGACDVRDMIMDLPSIQAGWDGEASLEECRWFTATFIDSPQEEGRLWRGVGAVRKFFSDLAALHYEATGEPAQLDQNLIEALQRRVMHAMYPSNYEVAIGAKRHSMEKVSENLRHRIPEDKWRKRYSS